MAGANTPTVEKGTNYIVTGVPEDVCASPEMSSRAEAYHTETLEFRVITGSITDDQTHTIPAHQARIFTQAGVTVHVDPTHNVINVSVESPQTLTQATLSLLSDDDMMWLTVLMGNPFECIVIACNATPKRRLVLGGNPERMGCTAVMLDNQRATFRCSLAPSPTRDV